MKEILAIPVLLFVLLSSPFPAGAQSAKDEGLVDCLIDAGPCAKTKGTLSAVFDITPKPVKVMREATFTVELKDGGRPLTDLSPLVGLTMPGMYMGTNRVRLNHDRDGIYRGTGVIIRCPSGKKVWKAGIFLHPGDRKPAVSYVFEVN